MLVEELVLSNQAQLERNETLTVQNEDLRGESNEVVSVHRSQTSNYEFMKRPLFLLVLSRKFLNIPFYPQNACRWLVGQG